MKVKRQSIFVSGAYRSKWGKLGVVWNIFKAWRAGRKLVRQGYSVFVPHLNTALMDDLQPVDFFLNCCLKELPNFEIIFMMRNWQNSIGAKEELAEAKRRGMEVWYEDINDAIDFSGFTPISEMERIIDSNPNWGKLEGCTEPVTVPYKLEPEVKS